jgi:hypothetical protein
MRLSDPTRIQGPCPDASVFHPFHCSYGRSFKNTGTLATRPGIVDSLYGTAQALFRHARSDFCRFPRSNCVECHKLFHVPRSHKPLTTAFLTRPASSAGPPRQCLSPPALLCTPAFVAPPPCRPGRSRTPAVQSNWGLTSSPAHQHAGCPRPARPATADEPAGSSSVVGPP